MLALANQQRAPLIGQPIRNLRKKEKAGDIAGRKEGGVILQGSALDGGGKKGRFLLNFFFAHAHIPLPTMIGQGSAALCRPVALSLPMTHIL